MISVIVCSRDIEKNKLHREHTINSAGKPIEYILIDNHNNDHSLCSAYNEGVSKANGNLLLFMHDDVFLVTKNWVDIIEKKFNDNKEMGALGVAGTSYLYKNDAFWCRPGRPFIKGKVIHEIEKKSDIIITIFSDNNRDEEVVVLDGLFMVIKADLFKNDITFDEKNFNGFHLYDLDISMQIRKKNRLFVTEDILVKHMSSGVFNDDWKNYAAVFLEKYRNELPATCAEEVPIPEKRIPFDSPSLKKMLRKETVDIISSIGKSKKVYSSQYYLAEQLYNSGNFVEAINALETTLKNSPNFAKNWHLLGLCYFKIGKIKKAIETLNKAINTNDADPMLFYNMGSILIEEGRYSEALQYLNKAIQIKSNFTEALNKITFILSLLGELTLAKKTCETILNYAPENIEAINNIGNISKDMGEIDESLEYYYKVLKVKPNYYEAYSNLLLNSHYIIDAPDELWKRHKEFGKILQTEIKPSFKTGIKKNGKRIKIGYLSPDLRTHSVSFFIKPVLQNHNKNDFEVFCYNDNSAFDETTELLKNYCDHWRDVKNLNNEKLIEIIRNDKLDIVIDLAGHSGNNRIIIFQHRLAPIQITYLGYPDTTGLSQMDYRITDHYVEDKDAEIYNSEKLIKLPNSFLCYFPIENYPLSCNTPALLNNHITFGSFNNFSKISNTTINLWIEILKSVANSSLLLKCRALNDKSIKEKTIKKFISAGINKDRLVFQGYTSSLQEHLSCYNKIDIALDTYPYNGTTTTCEALLMSVPVITLRGRIHASRVSASILENSGLNYLITDNKKGYVRKAIDLSNNFSKLNNLRKNIRDTFLQSTVCNSNKFIKQYEDALKRVYNES